MKSHHPSLTHQDLIHILPQRTPLSRLLSQLCQQSHLPLLHHLLLCVTLHWLHRKGNFNQRTTQEIMGTIFLANWGICYVETFLCKLEISNYINFFSKDLYRPTKASAYLNCISRTFIWKKAKDVSMMLWSLVAIDIAVLRWRIKDVSAYRYGFYIIYYFYHALLLLFFLMRILVRITFVSGSSISLQFVTDSSGSFRGFYGRYRIMACEEFSTTEPSNTTPPGVTCDRVFSERENTITSVNYPLPYLKNLDCIYTIVKWSQVRSSFLSVPNSET